MGNGRPGSGLTLHLHTTQTQDGVAKRGALGKWGVGFGATKKGDRVAKLTLYSLAQMDPDHTETVIQRILSRNPQRLLRLSRTILQPRLFDGDSGPNADRILTWKHRASAC